MKDFTSGSFEHGLCLYHDDPDGQCSAAIVRRALGHEVQMYALEIGDPLPWEAIAAADLVVLVDYSLPLADMNRIKSERSFVWVDHHVTALERLSEAMAEVPGKRSVQEAGCVLTWQTFFPQDPVPRAVVYVGDRDIWRHAHPETRAFGEGLYKEDRDPGHDELWGPLLDDKDEPLGTLIQEGKLLYEARMHSIERAVNTYGFEVTFEGHRTLAINDSGTGEMGEFIRNVGYDVAYCYVEAMRAGKRQTFVTLYSEKVDVSLIARKYGGGGHRGAAGFAFERQGVPFPDGSLQTSS